MVDIQKLKRKIESDSGREMASDQLLVRDEVNQRIESCEYQLEQISCMVCGSDDFEQLASKDRYGLTLSVSLCKSCGLICTNPRMNQEAYNLFYQKQYRQIYNALAGPTGGYFNERVKSGEYILNWVNKQAGEISLANPAQIVEIGCSAGSILYYFKNRGHNVIGCDLNESFIEFGKSKGLDIHAGTLHDIQDKLVSPPKLIIYRHVMEHILDPREELKLIEEVSDENTLIYIEVPGVKNLYNSYQMSFMKYLQNAHVFHFTARSLSNLLETSNFEVVSIDEYVRCVCRVGCEKKAKPVDSDYQEVMMFLETLYRKRAIKKLTTSYGRGVMKYEIKRIAKNFIKKLINYKQ